MTIGRAHVGASIPMEMQIMTAPHRMVILCDCAIQGSVQLRPFLPSSTSISPIMSNQHYIGGPTHHPIEAETGAMLRRVYFGCCRRGLTLCPPLSARLPTGSICSSHTLTVA